MDELELQDLNIMDPGPYRLGGIVGFFKFDNGVPYLGLDTVKLHRIQRGDVIKGIGDKKIYKIV